MGSQSSPKIPVVDLSTETLAPGSSAWISAYNDVRRALEDYGCFIVVYDKVCSELRERVFKALEELFDLPIEKKLRNTGGKPFHGYVTLPLHESLGIENAKTLQGIQSFTNLMWHGGNDAFCESIHSFTKLVAELDLILTRMGFESYGVSKSNDSHIESMTHLLRPTRYRVPKMNKTELGLAPHTDKTFMTILYQNQIDGLEVETKNGEWIGFELAPSSFVVIAGDALMAWSNDRIQSPMHRVTMSGGKVRYSLGIFQCSNGIIQAPDELVDDEHPLRFKPFEHWGYLRFASAHYGQHSLRSYCGV